MEYCTLWKVEKFSNYDVKVGVNILAIRALPSVTESDRLCFNDEICTAGKKKK